MRTLDTDARAFFEAGVRGAQADRVLSRSVWSDIFREKAGLRPLARYRRVRLAAFGKAALPMAGVAERHLERQGVEVEAGVVVVPEGYPASLPSHLAAPRRAEVLAGGHPVPTEASLEAGREVRALAEASTVEDLLLMLISGGGTALCVALAEGLSLEDARATYRLLLESGADIHAMNAVRKHLSRLGGGQLAQATRPAEGVALVVSDVPGDDLSVIASGPTVPDPTTFADAVAVLRDAGVWHAVPEGVRAHLARGQSGAVVETPKPGDPLFEAVRTRLVGTNRDALTAARAAAEERGYAVQVDPEPLTGEARVAGRRLARRALAAARRRAPQNPPQCRLQGGETTVAVHGSGTGGRNQELALAAALELDGADAPVALLSGGTDGIDGPTDAAGAVVTPATAGRARQAGLDPEAHLEKNDAHPLLDAAGALVRTGPTHTNVMDLSAVLIG